MANPGRDIFNMQADDVLAPSRQAEIAHVIAVLKRFQPTKIAVEGSFSARVLVVYGAGHIGWLQYAFAGNPGLRLRKLTELAK